jgi:hypothetical protein
MKVPRAIVPILIVLVTAGGLTGAHLFAIPSVTLDFPIEEGIDTESIRTVVFLVDGVKCVDTARKAGSTLDGLPGVIRYAAYASRNRLEITYDPARTTVEVLRVAIEGPVYDERTEEFLFHLFTVLEIDGREVHR